MTKTSIERRDHKKLSSVVIKTSFKELFHLNLRLTVLTELLLVASSLYVHV